MTTTSKPKICYVDESGLLGGAEIYLKILLEYFTREHEVSIVHIGDETHKKYYQMANLNQISFPETPYYRGLTKIYRYAQIIKKLAPDVVHVNQPAPDRCFHAIIAGRLASVKQIVVTCHLPTMVFKRSPLGVLAGKSLYDRAVHRIVFNIPQKVIAVSESGIDDLMKNYRITADRGICIPNGVDYDRFRMIPPAAAGLVRERFGIAKDHLLLATVGRLHSQKGFDALIKAFGQVYRRHAHVSLLIVGEGELRPQLEKLARDFGVEKVTHLVGQRDDIPEILAACDIYVNSSLYEGLPFSLLEAMASGLPVIASAVDGNKEVLKNGNGILVPQGDIAKMVESISGLIENEDYRLKLGKTGSEHVKERYSIRGMMKRIEEIYLG